MWTAIRNQVEKILLSPNAVPMATFIFQDHQLQGCKTALRREDVAVDAGLAGIYDFSLVCPASQFANIPLPQPRISKIMVDGKAYRVLSVEQDAAGATIRLHLGGELA